MGQLGRKLAPELTLGPFVLLEKLALGGMAEIWAAERDGQQLALKILQPVFSKDQTFRAMFQDEVDIATKLTHANIVQVYGAHEIDGFVFQSMELLEGRDLRRVLSGLARAGRWFPVRCALYVGHHLARALAYAHARRGEDGRSLEIVHRDVSPHNLMIGLDGRVKMLDFGIARAAERLARTRPGVVKGKIPYMAPEQALAVGVTPQTDIFAAGVVLWEMLAMRRLFRGESDADLLQQVVRAEIPPLTEANEKVPDDVAQLIHRMLAQRAANRPASMQEVENELGRMLARHFGEVTQEEFAEWANPYLEDTKRDPTLALPVRGADEPDGDPTEPTPTVTGETPAPADEDISADLSAEAQASFEEAMASWEAPAIGGDDTQRDVEDDDEVEAPEQISGPTVAIESVSRTLVTPDETGDAATARLRMPTRSEIIRAVDAVPTIPVRADSTLLAAIEKQQRVEVQTGPEIVPAPVAPIERVPATVTLPGADQVAPLAAAPTEETLPVPKGGALPLVALGLALMIVIVLALLVLAD